MNDVTDAVLMIIPFGDSFRSAIPDAKLPEVSCVYQVKSSDSSFGDLVRLLRESIVSFTRGRNAFGARIGVLLKKGSSVVDELYFEDWGGHHEIRGWSNEYQMVASADLPERLRSFALRKDVKLTLSDDRTCPHS
jgi:hypothetical protein